MSKKNQSVVTNTNVTKGVTPESGVDSINNETKEPEVETKVENQDATESEGTQETATVEEPVETKEGEAVAEEAEEKTIVVEDSMKLSDSIEDVSPEEVDERPSFATRDIGPIIDNTESEEKTTICNPNDPTKACVYVQISRRLDLDLAKIERAGYLGHETVCKNTGLIKIGPFDTNDEALVCRKKLAGAGLKGTIRYTMIGAVI